MLKENSIHKSESRSDEAGEIAFWADALEGASSWTVYVSGKKEDIDRQAEEGVPVDPSKVFGDSEKGDSPDEALKAAFKAAKERKELVMVSYVSDENGYEGQLKVAANFNFQ